MQKQKQEKKLKRRIRLSNEGWVKLHRKILESRWIKSPKVLSVFLQCILRANFKDNEVEDEVIKRGEFMTSTDSLSSFTSLTNREVRTALTKLKATNEIAIRTTNKYTIISVCKYEIYQSNESLNRQAERQVESHTNDKQKATKRQSNDNQTTTTKNDNNTNNEDNDKNDKNINKENMGDKSPALETIDNISTHIQNSSENRQQINTESQYNTTNIAKDIKMVNIESEDAKTIKALKKLKADVRLQNKELKLSKLLENEYFKNEEFADLWETFNEQRKKKPTIDTKITGLNKLFRFNLDESIEALENSIQSGWDGLFPKKSSAQVMNVNKPRGQYLNKTDRENLAMKEFIADALEKERLEKENIRDVEIEVPRLVVSPGISQI